METSPPPIETKKWPPERGWPLFLAWLGGLIAVSILYQLFGSAKVPGAISQSDWGPRIMWLVPALLGRVWQAWLVFRAEKLRFALWAALPCIHLFFPLTARSAQYAGLVIPLIEAALLVNIRRHAWAWILAGMAQVVLSSIGMSFAFPAGELIVAKLTEAVGTLPGAVTSFLRIGLVQGVWLLGETISAAVLAWKMPPVNSSHPPHKGAPV